MVVTPRLCSVNNFQLNTWFVALLFVYGSKTLNLFRYKLLTTSSGELVSSEPTCSSRLVLFKTCFWIKPVWFFKWPPPFGGCLFGASLLLETRYYSASSKKGGIVICTDREISKLDPNWVTGFVDGEGCFTVSIVKNKNFKVGWRVKPSFTIVLHERDQAVLKRLKNFFYAGKIYYHGPQSIELRVQSIKELEWVIKHFQKYPLKTKKFYDLNLLILVVENMKRKEHLTLSGLQAIVAIRASMNLGLSEELKLAFPDVVPVVRPLVIDQKFKDPNWLAGFTAAEGSFMINISESKTYSVGFQVTLNFVIGQHKRDEQLLKLLIEYLDCGNIYKNGDAFDFRVSKFNDIIKIIIPFFPFLQDL